MKHLLNLLFGSPLMVYDGDGGAGDANNSDADGGGTGTGTGQGGGGGGAATGGDNDKNKNTEPTTHKVTIDGEEKLLSLPELITLAAKSGGADKRFQEAAKTKKEAERGMRIQTLVDTISEGEPAEADVKELSGLLKVDSEEFMAYLNDDGTNNNNNNNASNKDKDKQTKSIDFDAEFEKRLGIKPAEAKLIIEHSQHRHVDDARKEIRDASNLAVDKDEIIGKMIVGKDSEETMKAVKEMVAEDVLRKIQDGVPFGADLIDGVLQRARQRLTNLGIPKKLNQQPIVLGLGPGSGLPSDIQADEPIERISSVDDKDEKNLVSRYMQKAVKAIREQR
jgi:hypothetical protein